MDSRYCKRILILQDRTPNWRAKRLDHSLSRPDRMLRVPFTRACSEKRQRKLVARKRIKTKSYPLTKGQLLALVCTYLAVFLVNQVVLWALVFLLRGSSLHRSFNWSSFPASSCFFVAKLWMFILLAWLGLVPPRKQPFHWLLLFLKSWILSNLQFDMDQLKASVWF